MMSKLKSYDISHGMVNHGQMVAFQHFNLKSGNNEITLSHFHQLSPQNIN